MKKIICMITGLAGVLITVAQTYPEPEFTNEVYLLKKDSVYTLVRLEKNNAKMDTKTKMAGFGGSESGYYFDGDKSPVRLVNGDKLNFVFSNGSSAAANGNNKSDSMMKANGIDPGMLNGMMGNMNDPASAIALYKVDADKNGRKILLQKTGSALPFSNHKVRSSDKYTFSIKKVHEGYWVLMVDKSLPKGEYAFSMMGMGIGAMGGMAIFAFGID